jgi:hypothetical protein
MKFSMTGKEKGGFTVTDICILAMLHVARWIQFATVKPMIDIGQT